MPKLDGLISGATYHLNDHRTRVLTAAKWPPSFPRWYQALGTIAVLISDTL